MGSLPVLSVNDEKAESSIKFVDGHYQVAIPSFKMAFQRLQTLEKRLMRSPEIAVDYNQVIENLLEKEKLNLVIMISGICHILLW